jgi:hypothetical protein
LLGIDVGFIVANTSKNLQIFISAVNCKVHIFLELVFFAR